MSHLDALAPDVALISSDCLDQLRQIKRRWPQCRVLVFTSGPRGPAPTDSAFGDSLIAGWITGIDHLDSLRRAVFTAAGQRKGRRLDRKHSQTTASLLIAKRRSTHASDQTLTPREYDVLRLLAQGMTLKEAARELHLSVKTVDTHAYRIMKKLNLRSRSELVLYAVREGIVTP